MLTTANQIFAFYTGLNVLILLVLSILTVRARVRTGTIIGDGGKEPLIRAQRAHGNASEYVPGGLIVLIALLGLGSSTLMLHIVGGMLTAGRVLHGIGLSRTSGSSPERLIGMLLTWLSFLVGAAACLYVALAGGSI